VRWSDLIEQFLGNLFSPNKVLRVRYDAANRRASITLDVDVIEFSTTMRLRLASELVGWDLALE
jgi:transcription antitermination factor NusA-like protein